MWRWFAGLGGLAVLAVYVAFFLSRNPGHAAGDELVCLTELSPANLTPRAAESDWLSVWIFAGA
jgi:hypothetical protein